MPVQGGKGGAASKRDTGVRYADVAGIDSIKEEIKEVLDILLGDRRYLDMGAHPVRVRGFWGWGGGWGGEGAPSEVEGGLVGGGGFGGMNVYACGVLEGCFGGKGVKGLSSLTFRITFEISFEIPPTARDMEADTCLHWLIPGSPFDRRSITV